MSDATLITNARVLAIDGNGARRGAEMSQLGAIDPGEVLIENGTIAGVGPAGSIDSGSSTVIDARGRVVMPAFVDAHTHLCWAGDRLDEWEQKRAGATYLDILKAGGGIMSTVRSVRAASEDDLAERLFERLRAVLSWGTCAIEVKSGYGLDTESELKMLRAIRRAAASWPGRVVPTALLGHAIDPDVDREGFIDRTVSETLPAVSEEFPGIAIDAYVEDGAWTVEEGTRLFETAMELGHPIRVHTDQFNELGMTRWAHEHGALTADHLEATSADELRALASSETFGVMLPCSGFHVDGRYADGRRFIEAGGKLVVATNWNPGSAPCGSVPMAIALAVRHNGVTAAEAITATTINAATLLGLGDAGRIAPGVRADVVMLRHRDERALGFEFGGNPVDAVWCGGDRVR